MFLDLFRKKMSPKNPQKYKVQLGRICINNQKIDLRKTAKEYSFCDFVSQITITYIGCRKRSSFNVLSKKYHLVQWQIMGIALRIAYLNVWILGNLS